MINKNCFGIWKKIFFAALLAASFSVCAAENNVTIGNVTFSDTGASFNAGGFEIIVTVIADNIIQVKHRSLKQPSAQTLVLAPHKQSVSVYGKSDSGTELVIKTKNMIVRIGKAPCAISFFSSDGRRLLGESGNGVYDGTMMSFSHNEADRFYGINGYNASEDSSKLLLRNNGGEVKAGSQGYAGSPFVWSTAGYGLLVDTDGCGFVIDEKTIDCAGTSRGDFDYFVITGKPFEIMKGVSVLSGFAPMLPKWSLGFMNSEWGTDEDEIEAIVKKYRAKSIPLDAYILDFDWKAWGEDDYGEWRWNADRYPSGPDGSLKKRMDGLGIKLVGIMKPRVHVNTAQGKYALEHAFFMPGKEPYTDYFSTELVNDITFANAKAAEWFWNNSQKAFQTGLAAVWNDEADVGFDNFGHFTMAKTYYEWSRGKSDVRTFSLNRNFYLGAQRYASVLWSGDIQTGFKSMAAQRERMLSAINAGQMKWSMDTGGFFGVTTPEIYARWMQFGAFVPVFRVHAPQDVQRQPWEYGVKAEKASIAAIRLRYALLPYIYSYEYAACETGVGIVRPLLFAYPDDAKLSNYVDAWFFGDYLVVAPVVDSGARIKEIYLPEGMWTDYFTGKQYAGGKKIKHAVDAKNWSDIPLYIREGAILPTQEVLNYTGEKKIDAVTFDIFPSTDESSFTYYDDDGVTYDYEKKIFFRQTIICHKEKDGSVFVRLQKNDGRYETPLKKYILKIHGLRAGKVTINNTVMTVSGNKRKPNTAWCEKDRFGELTVLTVDSGKAIDVKIIK